MAATNKVYGKAFAALGNKEVDLDSDTFKIMLVTSSYTFDQDAHDYKNDVTGELASGGGYTTGGATLSGVTWTYSTGTNTWKFDADDVSWASFTATGATGAVIYDNTPASDATRPLLCYIDFGGAQDGVGGAFDIQFNAAGIFTITVD